MPLYPGGFSQLHTKDQGEKTRTGSPQTQENDAGGKGWMLLVGLEVLSSATSFGEIIPCFFTEPLCPARPSLSPHCSCFGKYVSKRWRADRTQAPLRCLSSHRGRVAVQSLRAFFHFGCLFCPVCFPLGWWWVILNRMSIRFLCRRDKLLHVACQMALEAQNQLL